MRRRRGGMSMAITLVVLLTLSVLALAFGAMGINNLSMIQKSEAHLALIHGANGGLNELMNRMYNDPTYGSGVTDASCDVSGTFTTSQGPVYYWWTFSTAYAQGYCVNNLGSASPRTGYAGKAVPPLTAFLVVNADTVPRNLSKKPMRLGAIASKKFRFAVATDGTMDTRNINGTTGYPGSVWSNATSGTTIDARSIDGQAFSNAADGSIQVSSSPEGVPYYSTGTTPIPDIPVQDVVASYSEASATHNYGGPAFFQATGDVEFDTLSDGTLRVVSGTVIADRGRGRVVTQIGPPPPGQPDVEIYFPGSVTFTRSADIAPRMHLFIRDNLLVRGSLSQLPTTGTQDNFFFVGGSIRYNGAQGSNIQMFAGTGVDQRGSASYAGVVYVRDGNFEVSGGGRVSNYEGAILVKGSSPSTGNLDANTANIKYNPDLVTAMERFNISFSENTPVYPLSWWIDR